jgi:hypothetical protein
MISPNDDANNINQPAATGISGVNIAGILGWNGTSWVGLTNQTCAKKTLVSFDDPASLGGGYSFWIGDCVGQTRVLVRGKPNCCRPQQRVTGEGSTHRPQSARSHGQGGSYPKRGLRQNVPVGTRRHREDTFHYCITSGHWPHVALAHDGPSTNKSGVCYDDVF